MMDMVFSYILVVFLHHQLRQNCQCAPSTAPPINSTATKQNNDDNHHKTNEQKSVIRFNLKWKNASKPMFAHIPTVAHDRSSRALQIDQTHAIYGSVRAARVSFSPPRQWQSHSFPITSEKYSNDQVFENPVTHT